MRKDWEFWKRKHLQETIENWQRLYKKFEQETESPIESIALLHIKDFTFNEPFPLDYTVTTQYPIGRYTVDIFVHYIPRNLKIIIECDGHDFHERTKEQATHDKARDRFLTKNGYIVLRYTGSQICDDPQVIVNDIIELVYAEEE